MDLGNKKWIEVNMYKCPHSKAMKGIWFMFTFHNESITMYKRCIKDNLVSFSIFLIYFTLV